MVTITVLAPFRDTTDHVGRKVGDTFTTTEERAAQIAAKLPGYITVEHPAEDKADDLSKLSPDELRALCRERGIDAPSRAKKSTLISLLEG